MIEKLYEKKLNTNMLQKWNNFENLHTELQARCNAAVEMTRNSEVSAAPFRMRKERAEPRSFDYLTDPGDGGLIRNSSLETNSTNSSSSINGLNLNQSNNANSSQRHSLSSSNPDSGLCSLDLSDISLNGNSRTDISRVRSQENLKGIYRRSKHQIVGSRSTSALSKSNSSKHDRPVSVSSLPVTRNRSSRENSLTRVSDGNTVGVDKNSLRTMRMIRQTSATLPGWDLISNPPRKLNSPKKSDKRIEELVQTEREYVRSLNYIINNYVPEFDRADIPASLRGHRSALFGNLERLRDFHQDFLLPELESSQAFPHRLAGIFLRYEQELDMYALYVKNKPISDSLLAESGQFFTQKQNELKDKMDLASYLLKPVQRLSKYALFLDGIGKTMKPHERADLQRAQNLIEFQLRHGNDLLAMDCIKGCDIDLKEYGKLLRQNEFVVINGRKKAHRRIFLFENLCLFAKPKKTTQGGDIYQYKHSWMTSEMGLTAQVSRDPLKFELWLRRRNREVIIVLPNTKYVKEQWINEINSLLLSQASRYRDLRMKELADLGVGSKPFFDIEGVDTITDRSVNLNNVKTRFRNSVAGSEFSPRCSSSLSGSWSAGYLKRRPNSLVSSASSSDSSPLINTLNLHTSVSQNYSQHMPNIFANDRSIPSRTDSLNYPATNLCSLQEDESDLDEPKKINSYRQYETTV